MSVLRHPLLWLAGFILVGAAIRILEADQSLIADEMWSYTGATRPDIGAALDYVQSDEEITPPLFTLLAWLAGRLSDARMDFERALRLDPASTAARQAIDALSGDN